MCVSSNICLVSQIIKSQENENIEYRFFTKQNSSYFKFMCSRTAVSCIPRVYSELERTCVMLGIILTCRSFIQKLPNKHRFKIVSLGHGVPHPLKFLPCRSPLILKESQYSDLKHPFSLKQKKDGNTHWGPTSLSWPGNTFAFCEVS